MCQAPILCDVVNHSRLWDVNKQIQGNLVCMSPTSAHAMEAPQPKIGLHWKSLLLFVQFFFLISNRYITKSVRHPRYIENIDKKTPS
jgi:hypothetical protein